MVLVHYYVLRYNRPAVSSPLRPFGRFADIAALVLATLEDGPKHGYAMTLDIATRTGRRPGPAILYGAITRLAERQWIEPVNSSDLRRPYRLTEEGESVLREHLRALELAMPFIAADPAQASS